MYHFYDTVINDKTGVPLPGVIIRVTDYFGASVDIFADDSGTPIDVISGIANAAVTDSSGMFDFYVEPGVYTMTFYVGDAILKVLKDIWFGAGGQGSNAAIKEEAAVSDGQVNFTLPVTPLVDPFIYLGGVLLSEDDYSYTGVGLTLVNGVNIGDIVTMMVGQPIDQGIVSLNNVVGLTAPTASASIGTQSAYPSSPTPAFLKEIGDRVADIRAWSSDPTGNNDNASYVSEQLTQAAVAGVKSVYPSGIYALASPIEVPAGTVIEGVSGLYMAGSRVARTMFHIGHTGKGFVCTGATGGRDFRHIGTRRTQPAYSIGWAPTAHDFDFFTDGATDVSFYDILLMGATNGIRHAFGGGRFTHDKVWGQVYNTGIQVDNSSDVTRSRDVHFWDFMSSGSVYSDNVRQYMLNNLTAYYSKQNDNGKINGLFSIFHRHGLRIGSSGGLTSRRLICNGMEFDACGSAITVDSDANGATVFVDGMYGKGHDSIFTDRSLIQVEGTNSDVRIYGRVDLESAHRNGIRLTGSNSYVSANDVNVAGYNVGNSGVDPAAIWVGSGTGGFTRRGSLDASGGVSSAPTFGGTGPIYGAWVPHAPAVTAGNGSPITAYTVGDCKSRIIDGRCHVKGDITITTNGGAATDIRISLPVAANTISTCTGSMSNNTPRSGIIKVLPSGNVAIMNLYDGTYPGGNGVTLYYDLEYDI